jgi:murein DD-endopeptidase MepM/ murein hydrolase activator NlpD
LFGLALVWAALAGAQTFEATPEAVKQGDVIRLHAPHSAEAARMAGRTVRLFAAGGEASGLMPVPALEKPGEYPLEFLGAHGAVLHTAHVTVTDARFPRQNIVLGKELVELKPAPGEIETAAAFRKAVSDVRYWHEPFVAPLAGCRTSPYGVRRLHNGKPTGNYHAGVDQRGAEGEPIRAIADGVVRIVRPWNIHGNTVGVDHGQGVSSIYLHMSRFAVTEGAEVKRGDTIGYVGSTGRSTAPHLHWSLYINGVPVNPAGWVELHACAAPKNNGASTTH